MNRFFLFLSLLLTGLFVKAQPETYPLHWQYTYQLEPALYQTDSIVHTSVRPYNSSQVSGVEGAPQPLSTAGDTTSRTFVGKALWRTANDHLIQVDEDIFSLRVSPVMMFHGGREVNENQWVTRNTRGFQISGKLGDKFYFYSDFF